MPGIIKVILVLRIFWAICYLVDQAHTFLNYVKKNEEQWETIIFGRFGAVLTHID